MGEPIKRATLGAVAKEYEARGNVGGARQDQQTEFNPGAVFFGVYLPRITPSTRFGVEPGDTLFPYSFYPATISYQNAVKQLLRNKLKVAVDYSRTHNDNPICALTGAMPNHVCQFIAVGGSLYYAHIAIPDATQSYLYVDVNGTATNTEDDAFADILFMTNVVNGYAVAMCEKIETGGLSLEEVDDEIDTRVDASFVRSKLRTTTGSFVSSVSFSSDNRYLYITKLSSTAVTSVLANNQ